MSQLQKYCSKMERSRKSDNEGRKETGREDGKSDRKAGRKDNTKIMIYAGISLIVLCLIIIAVIVFMHLNNASKIEMKERIFAEFTSSCGADSLLDSDCWVDSGKKQYILGLIEQGLSEHDVFVESGINFGLFTFKDKILGSQIYLELNESGRLDLPVIRIAPDMVDLHNVSSKSVSHVISDFDLENKGNSTLIITDVTTSCSCLRVMFIKDGLESPLLGRFTNSQGWSLVLQPGETAVMRSYFDPRINAWESGWQNRWIYVISNDPITPKTIINVQYTHVE